jgi:serine/threonine protein kinase
VKEQGKSISEADGLKILKDLLLGMFEMHKNDLAHRDLKPENSLIHNDVHKIADYGFSTKIGGVMMKQ